MFGISSLRSISFPFSSRLQEAREVLRIQGIERNEAEVLIDEAYERAKKHVSNPTAVAVMKANIGLREENLPDTFHISDERMANYVEILKTEFTMSVQLIVEGKAMSADRFAKLRPSAVRAQVAE